MRGLSIVSYPYLSYSSAGDFYHNRKKHLNRCYIAAYFYQEDLVGLLVNKARTLEWSALLKIKGRIIQKKKQDDHQMITLLFEYDCDSGKLTKIKYNAAALQTELRLARRTIMHLFMP